MTHRTYVSRVVFDPDGGPAPGIGAWRHGVQLIANCHYTGAEIAVGADGVPLARVLVVDVDREDHAALRALPEVEEIPATLDAATRTRLESKLIAWGVPNRVVAVVVDKSADEINAALRELNR